MAIIDLARVLRVAALGVLRARARECANLAENMWVFWIGWRRHAEPYRVDVQVKNRLHRFVAGLDRGL